jgi:hypothetical protein
MLRRVLEQHHVAHELETLRRDVHEVDAAGFVGEGAVVASDRPDI